MVVKQKFFVHFSSSIINMLFHTISGIIVARIAGPTTLGMLNYGMSYVAMYAIILGLFGSSHTKLISEGRNLGDCIKTYGTIQSGLIIIYGLFFLITHMIRISREGGGLFDNTQDSIIFILFVSNFIQYFLNIMIGTFGARAELAKQSIPNLIQGLMNSILRVVVVVLGYGAIALSSASLFSTILLVPIVLYMFKAYPKGRFDFALAKMYCTTSIWFFIIQTSTLVLNNYGKVYLEHHSSVTEVGIYSGGFSLAGMLLLVASTSGTVFFPLFTKMVSEGRVDQISAQIFKYQRFLLIFILPLVLMISIYARHIITFVLGTKYLSSIPVLSILIISSFVVIFTLPYGNLITGAGKLGVSALISLSQVGVFIGLLYVFVGGKMMNLGSLGLAWVTLISFSYAGISCYMYSRKILKHRNSSYAIKFIGLSIILYVAQRFLDLHLEPSIVVSLIICLASLLTFYILCYLFKLADKSDLRSLMLMLTPSSSINYIKAEMNDKVV